ncbi:MAG: neuromedin U [Pseudomonadota bacterium]
MTLKECIHYCIVFSFFYAMTVHAESDLSLAKTSQNPLGVNPEARHFVLPFENYTNIGYANSTQNILDLKPVLPFRFTSSLDFIFRSIIPITHQPNGNSYVNGLGDINPTFFISPAANQSLLWGIGPTVVMPTATNKVLGAGKWSVGPELVLIAMPRRWTFAMLTYNVWSVAGAAGRPSVNQLTLEYAISYNFTHGWYVTTQPTLTANWFAASGQKWLVPFGIGVGRTFTIGNQIMNVSLQGYYNAIKPSINAPWTLQMNIEFLFPDMRTKL